MASSKKSTNSTGDFQKSAQLKLTGLEKQLDDVFVKNAPYQLPKTAKDWIVKYSPWISLIVGVIGLLGVMSLWRLGHSVNDASNYINQLSIAAGGKAINTGYDLGLFWWISLIVLGIQSVMQIAAYPGLRDRKKDGWNLLFYSALLSIVVGVAYLFVDGRGTGDFVSQVIGGAIGLYFLFQIRSYYLARGSKPITKES